VHLNTPLNQSVCHVLSISIEGLDGEALLMALQALSVSAGSACSAGSMAASHVLLAMKVPAMLAHSTVRFSLGRFTTAEDIHAAIELCRYHINKLRALSPLWDDSAMQGGQSV